VQERTFAELIDFDTGKEADFPPSRPGAGLFDGIGDNILWMQENGFDAEAGAGALHTLDMEFVALENAEWDTLSAPEALKRFYQGSIFRPRDLKPLKEGELPATFVFRTREHGIGLLQLVAFADQRPGATVRFKLVAGTSGKPRQAAAPVTAAISNEEPKLRFLAWQDEWMKSNSAAVAHTDGHPVVEPSELQLLQRVLPTGFEISAAEAAKRNPRLLHLWFSHPSFDRESLVSVTLTETNGLPIERGADGGMASNAHSADALSGNLGWLTFTLSPGEGDRIPSAVNLRLEYALGPPQGVQTVAPDFRGGMSLAGSSHLNGVGQDSDGKAFVAIAVDVKGLGSRVFCVVAVRRDGHELSSSGGGSSGQVGSGLGAKP
jgi:hypothetical protein